MSLQGQRWRLHWGLHQSLDTLMHDQWSSDIKRIEDKDAMLFNLSCCQHFPSKLTSTDIYCSKNYGPCFSGNGSSDLTASDEPLNGDGNCYSSTNSPGYDIPLDAAGLNMLTNKEDGRFTISELEVWEVTFLE